MKSHFANRLQRGGMAQPFRNIPHLLGTITNIEGSKNFSNRALASIKSELKKRQRLFDQYKVNHINDYTKLYKQKSENGDAAPFLNFRRICRAEKRRTGIYPRACQCGKDRAKPRGALNLGDAKPGGIIDDQIWSNSRFKVALKVQDANDSKEILKTGMRLPSR